MQKQLAWIIAALAGSSVTFIVAVAINATVANEPSNDYGRGFGWDMLQPAPTIALGWSALELILYLFGLHHCIEWLSSSVINGVLNAAFGSVGIALYSWDEDGSWVAGMFMVFLAVFYFVSMAFAAVEVHRWRQSQGLIPAKAKDTAPSA